MSRLQRSFYHKHYRPQFEAGITLDIEVQYGYPTVLLHELLERWPDEPEPVMEGVRRLLEAYRRTSVSASARWCLADMHLLRGEWAEAVEQPGGRRGLTVVVGAGALPPFPSRQRWAAVDEPAAEKMFGPADPTRRVRPARLPLLETASVLRRDERRCSGVRTCSVGEDLGIRLHRWRDC